MKILEEYETNQGGCLEAQTESFEMFLSSSIEVRVKAHYQYHYPHSELLKFQAMVHTSLVTECEGTIFSKLDHPCPAKGCDNLDV